MLGKIKTQYNNMGIAKKISAVLILVSIGPIIVAAIIASVVGVSSTQADTDMMIENNMQLAQKSIEEYFSIHERVILSIYSKNEYAEYLESLNVWDTKNYYMIKNNLEADLQDIAYIYDGIMAIAVLTDKYDLVVYDTKSISSTNTYCFDSDIREWKELALATFEEDKTLYSDTVTIRTSSSTTENGIYMAHRIINIDNYSKGTVGSLIICISEEQLRNTYCSEDMDNQLSFLCDGDGNIISASNSTLIGGTIDLGIDEELDEELDVEHIEAEIIAKNMYDNDNLKVYISEVGETGFYLFNVQDYDNQLKSIYLITGLIILLGLIMVLICIEMSMRFSWSIQKSVDPIIVAMNQAYSGDYEVQIGSTNTDEFGEISNHFDYMVLKIKESIIQEKEALVKEKDAELKALEAQINPHFLYNTLEAINWMAIDKDEFQISKMLQELANILRYSINKSNEIVTIENELDYLEKYIHLQQERFEYAFQYYIHVDTELLNAKIHKLLFQPVVENAIIHGFPGNGKDDYIKITIQKKEKELLEISIEDTGQGISLETCDRFNNYQQHNDTLQNSIGISNVILRLHYYYGDKGRFFVTSSEEGTCVTIEMPIQ